MDYLSIDELNTHLYGEVTTEINRGDNALIQFSIDAAIEEAKGYLTEYNTTAIFATTGDDRNPILLLYIKDITIWHYIQLSNPGVEMELRLTRYEKAIKWLEKVQQGRTNPNLPMPTVIPPEEQKNFLKYGSVPKRRNNF